jgi:Dockerin type I domain
MHRATLPTLLALFAHTTAFGYAAEANLIFSWATNGTEKGWVAGGPHTLGVMADDTDFITQGGHNVAAFYNSEFASAASCTAAVTDPSNTVGWNGGTINVRKYGCRFPDASSNPSFLMNPLASVASPPPGIGPGASASGTVTITDTTMTGTLTVFSTVDVPVGGTATSVGTGTNGYNLRSSDGTPFGNSWNGVTTLGTYTLNLTGVFTANSWQITGGTARFSDPGFLCQQGGQSSPANALCAGNTAPGGYTPDGGALSWGWDPDGSGAGTALSEIEVRDTGNAVIATLSGVRASLSVDPQGYITTNSGEIRRAQGSTSGCGLGPGVPNITYDAALDRISCGRLIVADLVITGNPQNMEDDTPDPFTFTDQENVPLGATITSDPVTVGGFNVSGTSVSVSGAASSQYSINGGMFTSQPTPVSGPFTVRVRHTSPATPGTAVNTVLTFAGVSDTFTSTTVPAGVSPDPFAFTDQVDVPLNTVVTSNEITITGLSMPVAIAISGADSSSYSINGGPFTALGGTVANGDTVRLRHTSNAYPAFVADTVLAIGAVRDTFTSTTLRHAIDDTATTSVETPVDVDVLANDLPYPEPLFAGVWIYPQHGVVAVTGSPGPQAGIRFTYTPSPGFTGLDTFYYWAEGGALGGIAKVTVTVTNDDRDGDGVPDSADNCTDEPNANQRDTNGDGYGNACDPDLNNSGQVTPADYAILRSRIGTADADADFNGSGTVTAVDYAILRSYLGRPPGPSGLHP